MSGFSAVLGNPPFLGGQKLTGTYGNPFRDFLIQTIANGTKGSADLCAYFFLVSFDILASEGRTGLVATNTISQGVTRNVGLAQIIADNGNITFAMVDVPWSGDAAVVVNLVTIKNGLLIKNAILNGIEVDSISEYLVKPGAVVGDPYTLSSNLEGCFQGSTVVGDGFVLSEQKANQLISIDERNKEVIFKYVTGKDANSSPDGIASRWIINFSDWPKSKAQKYSEPWNIVEQIVKPFRQKKVPTNSTAKKRFEEYWIYGASGKKLYSNLIGKDSVLIMARVSKTVKPIKTTAHQVFSDACVVFPESNYNFFGIITSDFHYLWTMKYASSLKGDTRYTPRDVFETFPRPEYTESVEILGRELNKYRASLMIENDEGLTKTYNKIHNPDILDSGIQKLRELHRDLDISVRNAYGWSDLKLGHGFHDTKQGIRWTIEPSAQREVLDRLLSLNHLKFHEE